MVDILKTEQSVERVSNSNSNYDEGRLLVQVRRRIPVTAASAAWLRSETAAAAV